MGDYKAPLREMRFVLEHVADLPGIAQIEGFATAELDTVAALLDQAGPFFEEVWAPTNRPGDIEGSRLQDGRVQVPEIFHEVYRRTMEGGWNVLPVDPRFSEQGVPWLVHAAILEMTSSGNPGFAMLTGLIAGAVEMLQLYASEEQKALYLPKLISGEWAGAMDLSEPEAGSNLGALRTRAVPQADGSYRISGIKRFISWGDHELTPNIVHLVLARTPGAPAGTKGISCFIVPKFLPNADGSPGARNDLRCLSVEQNLGLRASPTCIMGFGDEGGAIGHLIGQENSGMAIMFKMMNSNRLAVAIGAQAVAERAYQAARGYALQRVQGQPSGASANTPIVAHADVRRMLMTMKATVEAMRAMCYVNAAALDKGHHLADATERAEFYQLADLLTPVTKSWCTDSAIEVASLAIQIFGGSGFVEASGVAQHYRDLRIMPIYEGTNGIQALDLVGRKLQLAGGKPVRDLLGRMRALDGELAAAGADFAAIQGHFAAGVTALEQATQWIMAHDQGSANEVAAGATAYQRLFGGVLGAYLLVRAALAARRLRETGSTGIWDEQFLDAKLATAGFFCEQLLPLAIANLGPATSGAQTLFAIAREAL